jgi:hypothetical protein
MHRRTQSHTFECALSFFEVILLKYKKRDYKQVQIIIEHKVNDYNIILLSVCELLDSHYVE